MARGYHLVTVTPWRRINLLGDLDAQVDEAIEGAARDVPPEVPPDQVGPLKRRMRDTMHAQLVAARADGGLDFYYTAEEHHGFGYNATFVVSGVMSTTSSGREVAEALTELFRQGDEPVSIGGTVWARRERTTAQEPAELVDGEVPSRRVDYTTSVPGAPRRWIQVTFSAIGDGDLVGLVVELFDAMMSTWRWVREDD